MNNVIYDDNENLLLNINNYRGLNNNLSPRRNKTTINNRNNFNQNHNEYLPLPTESNNNESIKRRKISFKNTRRVRNIPRSGLSDPVSNLRRKGTRRVIGNTVSLINRKSQNFKNRAAVYNAHYLSRGNTISNIHSIINKNTNLSDKLKKYFKNSVTRKYKNYLND
jgi:hypothetical protein